MDSYSMGRRHWRPSDMQTLSDRARRAVDRSSCSYDRLYEGEKEEQKADDP